MSEKEIKGWWVKELSTHEIQKTNVKAWGRGGGIPSRTASNPSLTFQVSFHIDSCFIYV